MQQVIGRLIVDEARTLQNVRFSHQGRRNGLDCLGLIMAVADKLALRDKYGALLSGHDRLDYTKSPKGVILQDSLEAALLRVAPEHMMIGDILLLRMDHHPQHLAILTDYQEGKYGIIHAYAQARKVVEHVLDSSWQDRLLACYRIPASRQSHLTLP